MSASHKPGSAPILSGAITTRLYDENGLPLMIEPASTALADDPKAALDWFVANRERIESLLPEYGGVMLRGFAVPDTEAFNAFIDSYPTDPNGYAAGLAPREKISGKVFETSKVPAPDKIILHQEMGYLPKYPKGVAFYCHIPSETGGATTIGDARRYQKAIPATLLDSVRERGVLYRRNYRGDYDEATPVLNLFHRPWKEVLHVETREGAEEACEAVGCTPQWESDGSLSLLYRSPGFARHPLTGDEVWFAQVQGMHANETRLAHHYDMLKAAFPPGRPWPVEILYGDGGAIPEDLVVPLYEILDNLAVNIPYEHGDVMILDNIYTMHGREPFTGKRDVQVALMF
ncbi:MAG: TauD/TfdA family dioxygenase [Rhizomicrobium sp.]